MGYHVPSIFCRVYLRPPKIGYTDAGVLRAFECAPVQAQVTCNSHLVADTWEMRLELNDFPIDPRLVRGATVEIFAADLSGDAAQRDAFQFWAGLSRDEEREHCLIAGVADHVSNDFTNEGLYLRLKGRDYTAYWLDVHLEGDLRWGDRTFVQILADLIVARLETQALGLEIRLKGQPPLLLDPSSGVPVAKQAADAGASAAYQKVLALRPRDYKAFADADAQTQKLDERKRRPGESPWELAQLVALEAGFVIYTELDRLVLRDPQTLNPDTIPPATGTLEELRAAGLWRFTVGRNVSRYAPSRELGRQTNINVQCSSFNPSTGKSLVAYSPRASDGSPILIDNVGAAGPIADEQTKVGTAKKQLHVTPYVLQGITSRVQLEAIADSIREQLEHHDIEIEIDTDAMVDSNERGLWAMNYCDLVVIDFAGSLQSFVTRTVEQQVQDLQARGWDPGDVDTLLSGGQDDALGGFLAQLHAPLALAEITYKFEESQGEDGGGWSVGMKLRGRKQVDIRQELPPGKPPGKTLTVGIEFAPPGFVP